MRQLTKFKFTSEGGGSRSKYDWERLLDGTMWKLSADEMHPRENEPSFETIVRFRRTAHAAAKSRDLILQTQVIGKSHIVIQSRLVE